MFEGNDFATNAAIEGDANGILQNLIIIHMRAVRPSYYRVMLLTAGNTFNRKRHIKSRQVPGLASGYGVARVVPVFSPNGNLRLPSVHSVTLVVV